MPVDALVFLEHEITHQGAALRAGQLAYRVDNAARLTGMAVAPDQRPALGGRHLERFLEELAMVCRILDRNGERFGEPEGVVVAPAERVAERRCQFKRMVGSTNCRSQRVLVAKRYGIEGMHQAVSAKLELNIF
jgi:hypothetical protein